MDGQNREIRDREWSGRTSVEGEEVALCLSAMLSCP